MTDHDKGPRILGGAGPGQVRIGIARENNVGLRIGLAKYVGFRNPALINKRCRVQLHDVLLITVIQPDNVMRANLRLPTCKTYVPAVSARALSSIRSPLTRTPPCSTLRCASE